MTARMYAQMTPSHAVNLRSTLALVVSTKAPTLLEFDTNDSQALRSTRLVSMKHTIVLSDLHLWEAAPGDGLWMRYRQRRYFPDERIASLLDRLTMGSAPGSIEVVFNGDVFDFDIARPDGCEDPPRDLRSAVERMHSILDDHEGFLDAVAAVLSRGQRVVFISGNHDLPLVLEPVRAALRARIERALRRAGADPAAVARRMGQLVIKGWFHKTHDGILIEHGQQYDSYTSVPHPLWPVSSKRPELQQTFGSLTMRHLIGRLGYFNPNVDESFLLSLGGYFTHWLRYYAFTRRSLALRWVFGTLLVAASLLRDTERKHSARDVVSLVRAAQETGCDARTLVAHSDLEQPAAVERAFRLLCLDRFAHGLATLLSLSLFWLDRSAGVIALAATVALAVLFRFVVPEAELAENYRSVRRAQRAIAKVHDARAVVFGHTHIPEGEWAGGVFFGNCGSWAPMYLDIACAHPVQTAQPFVWLRSEGSHFEGGLYRFDGVTITPASAERPTVTIRKRHGRVRAARRVAA
jgi:UDP-2,3-diacylglucosamine pyrophosphatase LpxH